MSFDLAVWRRAPTTKTALVRQAYAAVSVGENHPAVGTFDAEEFVRAAQARLGPADPAPAEQTWVRVAEPSGEVADVLLVPVGTDSRSAVLVSGPYDWLAATITALVPLVMERDLMLYDPQSDTVYNNRRDYGGR